MVQSVIDQFVKAVIGRVGSLQIIKANYMPGFGRLCRKM
jgi:hypothetical protein